jgi:hypothetical protein
VLITVAKFVEIRRALALVFNIDTSMVVIRENTGNDGRDMSLVLGKMEKTIMIVGVK